MAARRRSSSLLLPLMAAAAAALIALPSAHAATGWAGGSAGWRFCQQGCLDCNTCTGECMDGKPKTAMTNTCKSTPTCYLGVRSLKLRTQAKPGGTTIIDMSFVSDRKTSDGKPFVTCKGVGSYTEPRGSGDLAASSTCTTVEGDVFRESSKLKVVNGQLTTVLNESDDKTVCLKKAAAAKKAPAPTAKTAAAPRASEDEYGRRKM